MDLSKLSPAALAAAMRGGTDGWGQRGSAIEHVRYAEPAHPLMRRRKCHCGCGKRVTHTGMANGVALFSGDLALRAYAGHPLFPMSAPTGGVVMIAGWVLLALAAFIEVL